MVAVTAIARMNIAAMDDADLALIRGAVARALDEDPGADPNGLLAALDEETSLRTKEPLL